MSHHLRRWFCGEAGMAAARLIEIGATFKNDAACGCGSVWTFRFRRERSVIAAPVAVTPAIINAPGKLELAGALR